MKNSSLTNHAKKRVKQRAIPKYAIEYILDFGYNEYVGGAQKFFFNHQSVIEFYKSFGKDSITKQIIDILRKIYIVVANDGCIITAAWRTKKVNRK